MKTSTTIVFKISDNNRIDKDKTKARWGQIITYAIDIIGGSKAGLNGFYDRYVRLRRNPMATHRTSVTLGHEVLKKINAIRSEIDETAGLDPIIHALVDYYFWMTEENK